MDLKNYTVSLDQADMKEFDSIVGKTNRSEKLRALIKEFLKRKRKNDESVNAS